MAVTFSIPDETVEAVSSELARVAEAFRWQQQRPDRVSTGRQVAGQPRPVPSAPSVPSVSSAPAAAPRVPHPADAKAIRLGQQDIDDLILYAEHYGASTGQVPRRRLSDGPGIADHP